MPDEPTHARVETLQGVPQDVAENGPEDAPSTFDLPVLLRFAELAVEDLAAAREEIDALNVFPVPDADTGTNLFLTAEAARDALLTRTASDADRPDGTAASQRAPDLRAALAAYARGALLGARGNSGVILSQLVGALMRRMAQAGPEDSSAVVFAAGLRAASAAAYAAVGEPIEGTILSVAHAAAEAAGAASQEPGVRLGPVVAAAAEAAHLALARTPDQLDLLRQAGVVDAGGRGLCVVLDAAETAVTGRRRRPDARGRSGRPLPLPRALGGDLPTGDLHPDGPAYEVMYLLDAEDAAVLDLRTRLSGLGDSVVVVGGEGLWNVHVHTDDVGAAVEAGIEAGTPRRIRVTHFAEQLDRARRRQSARTGRAVVAVAAGPGLGALFSAAGAVVVQGGPGRRPSTTQLLTAIAGTGSAEVVLLPNATANIGVAEAAAHAAGESGQVHVVVVPTRAQVQGLAALAVHEPGRSLESDVIHMTDSARGARHGGVSRASRRAMTSAGPCEPGDVLGEVQGDYVVVGQDLEQVATTLLDRLLNNGGELVTLVSGADAGDLAAACERHVGREHPGVDVVVHEGGQEHYPLLLAVE